MYGVLLCDAGVVALASQADQPRLHPADLLLLATFLRANDSLRQVAYVPTALWTDLRFASSVLAFEVHSFMSAPLNACSH